MLWWTVGVPGAGTGMVLQQVKGLPVSGTGIGNPEPCLPHV